MERQTKKLNIMENRIFNENCLDTMSKMPDNFIDLVITSPPYNKAGYEGFIRKSWSGDTWSQRNIDYDDDSFKDFMREEDYQAEQIKVLDELHRVLKPNGSIFYNHKVRVAKHKASHPIEWILKSKLTFRQQIIWDRKSSPAVAPIRYLPSTELIFWLTKTPCQPNFNRDKECNFLTEVWTLSPKPNKFHPAPFPEEIPRNILNCIKDRTKDFIVYDPYSGIGTTVIEAKKMGLKYIGSDLSKKYIEYSEEILKNI